MIYKETKSGSQFCFGKEPSQILIVVGCHQNSVRPWQSATLVQRLSVQCIWRGPVFAEWLKALWRRYNLRILLSFEEEEGRTIWDRHNILIHRTLQHVWVLLLFWYCFRWQGLWKKLCSSHWYFVSWFWFWLQQRYFCEPRFGYIYTACTLLFVALFGLNARYQSRQPILILCH